MVCFLFSLPLNDQSHDPQRDAVYVEQAVGKGQLVAAIITLFLFAVKVQAVEMHHHHMEAIVTRQI